MSGDTITEDDIWKVKYFHTEKGDITRWVHWDDKKSLFEKQFPELIDAMKRAHIAEKTLDAIVNNLD